MKMIDPPHLDWIAIAPELLCAIMAIVVLLVGLSNSRVARGIIRVLTAATFVAAGTLAIGYFNDPHLGAFTDQIDADQLANLGRVLAAGCGLATVAIAIGQHRDDERCGEFHALLLACVTGMGLMVASSTFVGLFIGLELFSLCLYVLCALQPTRATSLESGLKYLIIGGVSSAVLLYGAALVYGATGSFNFVAIGQHESRGLLLIGGGAMALAGLSYKISAAPMHWWTPDVYTGAETTVTAFMATATKAIAFLALSRVLITAFRPEADTWIWVVAALSVISIVVGNIGAIVQQSIKRMLAYSSIAQAGYLLIALVAWQSIGMMALAYALIVYVVMTFGAFAWLTMRESQVGHHVTWDDVRGQGWNRDGDAGNWLATLPALGMTICMLSLAGIPPIAGFFSKFVLFQGAVQTPHFTWLAVVGVLGSAVSLSYYMRIIVELYSSAGNTDTDADVATRAQVSPITSRRLAGVIAVACAAGVIVLAVLPGRFTTAGCDLHAGLVSAGTSCVTPDTGHVEAASATAP